MREIPILEMHSTQMSEDIVSSLWKHKVKKMVDKLFMMMPEFNVFEFDKAKALKDYKALLGGDKFNKAIASATTENVEAKETMVKGLDSIMQLSEEALEAIDFKDKEFKEWFEENKEKYRYKNGPKIKKVTYKHTNVENLNRRQRNNLLLDISYSILQNPQVSEHFNSPGNFNNIKISARKATILNDRKMIKALIEEATQAGVAPSTYLDNMSLKALNKFIGKYQTQRNLISPSTFAYFHRQNMTGGKLIGMYANNTTIQAKTQGKELFLDSQYAFMINGREIRSLSEAYVTVNGKQMRISKNCAEFSAASVDNAKDPVLADLMQNTETAAITGAMLRMGLTINEIGLLYSSPLVRWYLKQAPMARGEIVNDSSPLANLLSEKGETSVTAFNTTELQEAIIQLQSQNLGVYDVLMKADFTKPKEILLEDKNIKAAAIIARGLQLFSQIEDVAKELKDAVGVQRADSPNGAIQNTIAKAVKQLKKVDRLVALDNYYNSIETAKKSPNAVHGLLNTIPRNDVGFRLDTVDKLRERFRNSNMPMLQAFHTLGIDFAVKTIAQYYAPLTGAGKVITDRLFNGARDMNINDKILEKFLFNMTTYSLSKTKMFGNDGTYTYKQKRDYYLKEFPAKFEELKKNYPELLNNNAIKAVVLDKETGELIIRNSARKSATSRQMLMADFEAIFYMNHPLAVQIATDLFAYTYYKDGFAFGPNSFGNMFSPTYLNNFPEIMQTLRTMGNTFTQAEADKYYYQFMLQNGYNVSPNVYLTDEVGQLLPTKPQMSVPYGKHFNKLTLKSYPFLNINGILYQFRSNGSKNYAIYDRIGNLTLRNAVYDANSTFADLLSQYQDEVITEIEEENEFAGIEDMDLSEIDAIAAELGDVKSVNSILDEKANQEITDEEAAALEKESKLKDTKVETEYNPQEGLDTINEKPC
jgi:hypothetical protein